MKLGFIRDSREVPNRLVLWGDSIDGLALFPGPLQMVLELPSNARHVVLEHRMTWP
jgi:hypothetical protein